MRLGIRWAMFTKLLDEIRDKKGLTDADIADALGLTQSTINRIRQGKQMPMYDTGVKIIEYHNKLKGKRK